MWVGRAYQLKEKTTFIDFVSLRSVYTSDYWRREFEKIQKIRIEFTSLSDLERLCKPDFKNDWNLTPKIIHVSQQIHDWPQKIEIAEAHFLESINDGICHFFRIPEAFKQKGFTYQNFQQSNLTANSLKNTSLSENTFGTIEL